MNEKSWELYSQILAQENVHLEYSQYARTAYFDLDKRVVTIPMFEYMNDEVTQLLISHEVGHACHSTYTMDEYRQYTSKYKDLFNVVEDAHVENKLTSEFNGLRSIFFNGYKTLYVNNFFELNEDELSKLTLTERLNLYYKIGHVVQIPFFNKESEFAVRMKFIMSKEEVVLLCEDVIKYLHELYEESDVKSIDDKSSSENEDSSNNDSSNNDSSNNDKNSSTESSRNYDLPSEYEERGNVKNFDDVDKFLDEELSDTISNTYYKKLEEYGEKQIVKNDLKSSPTLNLSTKKCRNNIFYYPDYYHQVSKTTFVTTKFCLSWIKRIKELARSADSVFQQKKKAEELKNVKNVRLGKLNLKKISYYKISENIFKQRKIITEGKNHAIVILIDYSSSMENYLKDTIIQACILGEFCRMNEIPFVILAFGIVNNSDCVKRYHNVAVLGHNDNFDIGSILYLSKSNNMFFKPGDTPTVNGLLTASYYIECFKSCDVEKTSLYLITDGVYNNDVIIDKKSYSFYRNSKFLTIDNVLYNIDSIKFNHKVEHKDWIIELLCLNLRRRFKTFISVSYLGDYESLKERLSDKFKKIFCDDCVDEKGYTYSTVILPYTLENYLYLWKHAYYFENCKKIPKQLTNGVLSYKFKNNPFINQFQFFDSTNNSKKNDSSTSKIKNVLTENSLYYKKLKIFVNGFIEEFS